MSSSLLGVSGGFRSGSNTSRIISQDHMQSNANVNDREGNQETEGRLSGVFRQRKESSPSRLSFSSSLNQKTPARSYYQHSLQESHAPVDISKHASQGVREDTAELASYALSDIASSRNEHSPSRHPASSTAHHNSSDPVFADGRFDHEDLTRQESNGSTRHDAIQEVSEPSSLQSSHSSQKSRCRSALTEMIRNSPPTEAESLDIEEEESFTTAMVHSVTVSEGIISQPSERTPLLKKRTAYGSIKDLESQETATIDPPSKFSLAIRQSRNNTARFVRMAKNTKSWNKQEIWKYGIRQPLGFVPPVILGLLLNILDALSYGMILFPLGNKTFAGLGPDGISMFYVSCVISQLVYSLGGSIFKGGVGSEMIEIVPFLHKMAFTILARVGEGNRKSVLATTVTAYAMSSILTGIAFYLMGVCKLGSLIGFFPRHILLGCIGGVGFFLVVTGLEVSARLDGNLEYNMATLHKLVQLDTLPLWLTALALAIILLITEKYYKHPLFNTAYFLSIIAIFYFFVAAIPDLKLPELRAKGWVFEAPEADLPWYHFYTLYDFRAVNWEALLETVPAQLSLIFFGVLHVPINIPAVGLTAGEDNVDIDRELRAHGISNALSGLCGSIQNYLVYTNTVLFMRSGGDSRVAGVMLAAATSVMIPIGLLIICFIPVNVVGALIFYMGFQLMHEALVETWGKVNRLEYATIVSIIVVMVVVDFVIGILVGILLACVSFVVQTSRVSAIRGKLYGGVANSTVRRHPIHQRFLQDAGRQIEIKQLAGHLFFGTIVGVEKEIRGLLEEPFQQQPTRFLVLDLCNVDGVDYSAAEAFTRINRILSKKDVQLVICGFVIDSGICKSLRKVGLFDEGDGVQYFRTLNSALEYCENELLKALYQQRDRDNETESTPAFLEVPKPEQRDVSLSEECAYGSPRQHYLHQVATKTLSQQDSAPPSRWQDYRQPLQLILQTFSTVSDKPEDFWYRTTSFFIRQKHSAGTVLYSCGDRADGFYLLESGMLKADYDFPQGKYSEIIVAGTTCGELPFFSDTERTSTTSVERDCVIWMLDDLKWQDLQNDQPDVSKELLRITLKLTSERMNAITKHMLLQFGSEI